MGRNAVYFKGPFPLDTTMNRTSRQPNVRVARKVTRAESSSEDRHLAAPSLDDDLAGSFFEAGLSEDVITAAHELEQSRDDLRAVGSGRANRWIYGVAAIGAFSILALGLGPRLFGSRREAPPAAAVVAVAPSPVQTFLPVEPSAVEPSAVPTLAAEAEAVETAPRIVSAAGLRAGSAPVPQETPPTTAGIDLERPLVAEIKAAVETPPVVPDKATAQAPAPEAAALVAPPSDPIASCTQLLRRGKFSDIKSACTAAFAVAPDATLAVKVARNALERERYADAQSWAQRAININGDHGEAFLTLGGAEQGLGHAALARIAYARYLELEPNGEYAEDVRALINSL